MSCVQAVANSPLAMWHAGVEPNIGWITRYKIQEFVHPMFIALLNISSNTIFINNS